MVQVYILWMTSIINIVFKAMLQFVTIIYIHTVKKLGSDINNI